MSPEHPDASSMEKAGSPIKSRKKTIIISTIGGLIIIIALAVGLGVGLTRRNHSPDNDDTPSSPSTSPSTPSANITTPSTNHTALWQPTVGTPFQIILLKPLSLPLPTPLTPDVPIWDIDIYLNNSTQLSTLHSNAKRVICYFSAGTYESFRPDASLFPESVRGTTLDGYADEKWLDIRSPAVREVVARRIDYSAERGCDAIDPDNIDAYNNQGGGFGLSVEDSVEFVKWMSGYAKGRGMSMGLKNGGDILERVLGDVAFVVNEQCVEFGECAKYSAAIKAGKPVFHIEYKESGDICKTTGKGEGSDGFSTVFKHHAEKTELDGYVRYCDGKEFTTSTDS